jgi:hypothetical protein
MHFRALVGMRKKSFHCCHSGKHGFNGNKLAQSSGFKRLIHDLSTGSRLDLRIVASEHTREIRPDSF